jgi:hypothetical protein
LGELDEPFNRFVSHFQSFASLAYYYNKYVKFISYSCLQKGWRLLIWKFENKQATTDPKLGFAHPGAR